MLQAVASSDMHGATPRPYAHARTHPHYHALSRRSCLAEQPRVMLRARAKRACDAQRRLNKIIELALLVAHNV